MRRRTTRTTLATLAALLALGAGLARADGGRSVAVKPLAARPGDPITVTGAGLGASRQVEIRLVGQGLDLDLGELAAAADGDFEGTLTLPPDLRPGTYQLRAVGDGAEATQLTLLPAGATAPAEPTMGAESLVAPRPLGEAALLVALFGVLAGLGLLAARTATRAPRGSAPRT